MPARTLRWFDVPVVLLLVGGTFAALHMLERGSLPAGGDARLLAAAAAGAAAGALWLFAMGRYRDGVRGRELGAMVRMGALMGAVLGMALSIWPGGF